MSMEREVCPEIQQYYYKTRCFPYTIIIYCPDALCMLPLQTAAKKIGHFFMIVGSEHLFSQLWGKNFFAVYCNLALFALQVNTHGQLSFRAPFIDFTPESFPLQGPNSGVILIAPFWDDIDTTGSSGPGGQLFFRQSGDESLLAAVGAVISGIFMKSFSPTLLFIATWEGVPESFNINGVCL